MKKNRAQRNRTISLTQEEIKFYISECINEHEVTDYDTITNTVIFGDAFKLFDKLPPKCVDLLIVDPPYNLNKTFGTKTFKQLNSYNYSVFTEKWVDGVKRLLTDSATLYVCSDWKTSIIISQILENHFVIQNRITWQREKGRGAKRNWKNSLEDIWFCTVSNSDYTFNVEEVKLRRKVIAPYKLEGKPKDWVENENGNYRDTYPSNFWDDITIPFWSMPENTDHPTQKPEKLIAKLILASSKKGDLVFDPFLGSGTTAVVAKKLGRRFIGIESEEEYCALSQKRLEIASKNNEIQGYTDGVFWERNSLSLQEKFKHKNKDRQLSINFDFDR